jgi:hypothetical protein
MSMVIDGLLFGLGFAGGVVFIAGVGLVLRLGLSLVVEWLGLNGSDSRRIPGK